MFNLASQLLDDETQFLVVSWPKGHQKRGKLKQYRIPVLFAVKSNVTTPLDHRNYMAFCLGKFLGVLVPDCGNLRGARLIKPSLAFPVGLPEPSAPKLPLFDHGPFVSAKHALQFPTSQHGR